MRMGPGLWAMLVFLLITATTQAGLVKTAWGAGKPTTIDDIALYQGADREQLLIEGAKKEGQVMFYNSLTSLAAVAQEFEKKYSFIKVSIWRSDSTNLIRRITEEYASGRFLADVIETSGAATAVLHRKGIFHEYYSPEVSAYGEEVKVKGKSGIYYMADRENYTSLGFNTKLVPPQRRRKLTRSCWIPDGKGRCPLPAHRPVSIG